MTIFSLQILFLLVTSTAMNCSPVVGTELIAIKEGADLLLSCPIVVPNEDMIISWTCDDEPADIKSSRIHITSAGKLRILSAKVGDSCNYRCEAADGFGTLSVIMKVIIVDNRLLELLAKKQNLTLPKGSRENPSILLRENNNNNNKHHKLRDGSERLLKGGHDKFAGSSGESTNREHYLSSNANHSGGSQLSRSDLEIRVEPANVHINKNETLMLECRVRHANHLISPQIIWLKEFIGRKPNSLSEAHNQNLLLIDGKYFHPLNWPRSITYSRRSDSANSALLIRQSNFAHSGRYICFAGYPPTIMSTTNLSSGAATTREAPGDVGGGSGNGSEPPTERGSLLRSPYSSSYGNMQTTKSLKYKMASSTVRVNDEEGERSYKSALLGRGTRGGELASNGAGQDNWFLVEAESRNNGLEAEEDVLSGTNGTWTRNLTIFLLIACSLCYLVKFLYVRQYQLFIQQHHHKPSATTTNLKTKLHSRGATKNNNISSSNNNNDYQDNLSLPSTCQDTTEAEVVARNARAEVGANVSPVADNDTTQRQQRRQQYHHQQQHFLHRLSNFKQRMPLPQLPLFLNHQQSLFQGRNKLTTTTPTTAINAATLEDQSSPIKSSSGATSADDKSSGYLLNQLASFQSQLIQGGGHLNEIGTERALSSLAADNDHLYSEIGEGVSKFIVSNMTSTPRGTTLTLPTGQTNFWQPSLAISDEYQVYKVPNCIVDTNFNGNNGEN